MPTILRLFGLLKKYWKWVIITYIFLMLSMATSLAVPQIIKIAMDKALHLDAQTGQVTGSQSMLIYYGLAIIGLQLLKGVLTYGQSFLGEFIGQKVAYDLRNKMYDRIQRLSFAFHDKAQTGQLMSRATQDVESIRMFVGMGSIRVIYVFTTFISILIIMMLINWSLTLVSIVCLPFIVLIAANFGAKLRPLWTSIQQQMASMSTVLQENLTGIRVVKAFSRQRLESEKFEREARILYDKQIGQVKIQAFSGPLMNLMTGIASALIIGYGGMLIINQRLTAGELTQFYFYIVLLVQPIRMLGFIINQVSRGIASGQRIFEVLDTESAVKEKPNAVSLTHIRGDVKFEDVYFSYTGLNSFKSNGNILEDVNLEAKPGEMVALLGATGSGKTTLINLIPRFYDVTAGRITIDDIDIRDITLASLRKHVGIVQQEIFLFSASIKENIAYGAIDATMEAIIAATKTAELHEFIHNLPQGYDTWVGERGVTLSGGQKQRLAIARTLLINPRILILDDSMSSVDTETEFLIQRALRELMKGRTTFVIAQRLQTVKDAQQIFVLDKGKIVESGTHSQLLQEGKIYREIYELQLKAQEEAIGREVMR